MARNPCAIALVCLGAGCGGGGGADGAVDLARALDAALGRDAAALDAASAADAGVPDGAGAPDGGSPPSTVFLSFEGDTLTPGQDDATTDQSSVVIQQVTTRPFLAGDPMRAAKIAAIVAEVKRLLAPFAVDVVTARPKAGPYDMILIGGAAADIGAGGSAGAVGTDDCDNMVPSNIEFAFDTTAAPGDDGDRDVMAAKTVWLIAIAHGGPTSAKHGDCLCGGSFAMCPSPGAPCTFGGAGTPLDHQSCPVPGGADTVDELPLLLKLLGRR